MHKKRDADAHYLSRVKIAFSSCIDGINFANPVNSRKEHEELMKEVRNEAIHISNKYKVQIEPLCLKWDKFIPTLEKTFPDVFNKMLSHNSQQQP